MTDSFLPPTTSNSLPLTNMLDSAVGGAKSGSLSPPSASSSPPIPVSGVGGAKDFSYQQIPAVTAHNQLSLGVLNHLVQQQQPSSLQQRVSPINGIPNLPQLHQTLSQQLSQYQQTEQTIILQLKSLPAATTSSGTSQASQQSAAAPLSPQEQALRQSLSQVTNNIKILKQQLTLITKLHTQQLAAQASERQELPPSMPQTPSEALEDVPSEPSSRSSMVTTPGDINYGMQSMSLSDGSQSSSISQSSARTISRLHRIISGSGGQESTIVDKDGLELSEINSTSVSSSEPSTTGTYTGDGGGSSSITTPASVTTPSGTSSLFGSTRSVDEIPEFKPGVPWQGSKSSKTSSGTSFGRSMSVDQDMFLSVADGPGTFGSTTPGAFTPQPIGHRNSLGSGAQFDIPRQYSPNQQRMGNGGGRYTYKTTINSSSRTTTGNYRQVGSTGQGLPGYSNPDRLRGNYSNTGMQQSKNVTTYTGSAQKQNQKWNFDNNPWGMPVKSG